MTSIPTTLTTAEVRLLETSLSVLTHSTRDVPHLQNPSTLESSRACPKAKKNNNVSNDSLVSNAAHFEATLLPLPSPPGLTASCQSSLPCKDSVSCTLGLRQHTNGLAIWFSHQESLGDSRESCSLQRPCFVFLLDHISWSGPADIWTGQTFHLVVVGRSAASLVSVH